MSAPPVCRGCGSSRVTLRGHKRGKFIPRDFAFYHCGECELLFVEPFSGFEIYNEAYYRGEGPDPFVDYETEYRDWRRTDRALELEDLTQIAERFVRDQENKGRKDQETKGPKDQKTSRAGGPLVPLSFGPLVSSAAPPPLRWLDFGCGAGALLKFLRERRTLAGRPLELTGHDVGSYADRLARDDGFRILDLEQVRREPDASCDIISMIEVLEHLPEPHPPLALIARLLKPGGLLLLTTGNLDSPMPRRQGLNYGYCTPEVHVSLFNPRCLARLYARVGLTPQPVHYHGAVKFKVLKTLRHRPAFRALARAALAFPPTVRLVDALYGVSAMPCATKPLPR